MFDIVFASAFIVNYARWISGGMGSFFKPSEDAQSAGWR
jgi:hypothetical protein